MIQQINSEITPGSGQRQEEARTYGTIQLNGERVVSSDRRHIIGLVGKKVLASKVKSKVSDGDSLFLSAANRIVNDSATLWVICRCYREEVVA
jgi:hypothetical protein